MIDLFGREWTKDAICREVGEAPFFYPYEKAGEASRRELDIAAKAICAVCKVSEECLRYSLETQEIYGTWGGWTESERAKYLERNAG